MNINENVSSYIPPYEVIIFDMLDAFYWADVVEKMELFDTIDDLGRARAVADALFVLKHYKFNYKSLQEMNELDDGYDVRVFDKNFSCVYAAHTKFKDKWIGN